MCELRLRRVASIGCWLLVALPLAAASATPQPGSSGHRVSSLQIKILSTMLADEGFGEWGFAALAEVDGRRILFDTGANDDTVQRNVKALGLDLSDVELVVLSHNHGDHTTGLLPLRRQYVAKAPRALGTVYVGQGILWPQDMALVFQTDKGLVYLFGCGHAGVINTLEHTRKTIDPSPVKAVIGGLQLFAADDQHLAWTAAQLKAFGVQQLVGAHCTGIEAVYRIRELAGLTRQTCMVGAVGASYSLTRGIDAVRIAK